MSRYVSRSELARLRGVNRSSVTQALKPGGALYGLLRYDGFDIADPRVADWLSLGPHGSANQFEANRLARARARAAHPYAKNLGPVCRGVYVVFSESGSYVKIGWSRNINARLKQLQIMQPTALRLYGIFENAGVELESLLHALFSSLRVHGEWFKFSEELESGLNNFTGEIMKASPRFALRRDFEPRAIVGAAE